MEQNNFESQVNNQSPVYVNETLPRPMLGFAEAVKICFAKYATFSGRARRSEYWWFSLFLFLVGMASSFLDGVIMAIFNVEFVDVVTSLLLFIPGLAVSIRRLHDVGRSGWWVGATYLLSAVAIIIWVITSHLGAADLFNDDKMRDALLHMDVAAVVPFVATLILGIVLFVFALIDSHKTENKYGLSPKYQ